MSIVEEKGLTEIEVAKVNHEPIEEDTTRFRTRRKWFYRGLVVAGTIGIMLFTICLIVILL